MPTFLSIGAPCDAGPACNIESTFQYQCGISADCSQFFYGWSNNTTCLRLDGAGYCCAGNGLCTTNIGTDVGCPPDQACNTQNLVSFEECQTGCANLSKCVLNERITIDTSGVCLINSDTQSAACPPLECQSYCAGQVSNGECMRFMERTYGFCGEKGECVQDITQCKALSPGIVGSGVRCASPDCVRISACEAFIPIDKLIVPELCYEDYSVTCGGNDVNVCGPEGTCVALLPDGSICSVNGQCISGYCPNSTCISRPLPNGDPCQFSRNCASGFCVNGTCCDSECAGTCTSCAKGECTAVTTGACTPCTTRPPASIPGVNFTCVAGVWTASGSIQINTTSVIINVTSTTDTISATGCVNITTGSVLQLNLGSSVLDSIFSSANASQRIRLIESQASCIAGSFDQIQFTCSDQSRCESQCLKGDQEVEGTKSISLLFTYGCASPAGGFPWWGILIAAIAAAALLIAIVIVLFRCTPCLKNRAFPFQQKREQFEHHASVNMSP
jgi:hypothetical protein